MKYCNRPFSSTEEMNNTIIKNYNTVVKPKDEVYMLGDFAFVKSVQEIETLLSQLNGKKYLIYGNHDRNFINQSSFIWKKDIAKINIQGQKIILCHYSMRVWDCSHYGSWNLYGHSHNCLEEFDNILACDVGVDAWNFCPVSFEQIKEKMSKKNFIPINKR
jgi:calcineurin-like phosphoesterase family protein